MISLNYRLAPYPDHPTHPTPSPGTNPNEKNTGRDAHWPDPLTDILTAILYLASPSFENDLLAALAQPPSGHDDDDGDSARRTAARVGLGNGKEWILGGHSVGATMAMMIALEPWPRGWLEEEEEEEEVEVTASEQDAWESAMGGLRGVVALEGVYDFTTLRDAHLAQREFYEPWISEVFGPEHGDGMEGKKGGWGRGSVMRYLLILNEDREKGGKRRRRGLREGVGKVVVGHSWADEAVEWAQSEGLVGVLRERMEGREKERVELVEVRGGHDEVVEEGVEIGRCVGRVVEALLRGREISAGARDKRDDLDGM